MECSFCNKELIEKEIEDMYCHCCGALTDKGILNALAKKLRGNGWANATEHNVLAVVDRIIVEYQKMEEKINQIKQEAK